jgi:uncharacterized protein YhbP (UPF0306 family)
MYMSNPTVVVMVAVESKEAIDRLLAERPEADFKEKMLVAVKAAKEQFMAPNDDEQFKGVVAALYERSDDAMRSRIKADLESLKILNAMLHGVQVDLSSVKPSKNPLGLMGMFHECREQLCPTESV